MKMRMRIILERNHAALLSLRLEITPRVLHFSAFHYYTVVGSVCLCVCVSVIQNLTYRPTNDTTYLTGNEGQKNCAVFSENAPLQS